MLVMMDSKHETTSDQNARPNILLKCQHPRVVGIYTHDRLQASQWPATVLLVAAVLAKQINGNKCQHTCLPVRININPAELGAL